jgi:dual specificity tyrosine-phosphorylation-regulated kinase 2/3/4|eukprot:g7162.t1
MSSFGSSVSRRRKNTTKSTFGSRKLSTSRPSSHGKINSNNNKRVSGGRKKKSNNSVEKRNPPGFEKTTKLGEGGFGTVWDCKMKNSGRSFAVKQLVKGPTSEAKRNVETGLNEQWFGRMWFDEGGSLRTMLGICEAMDPPEDEDDDSNNAWLWKVNPSIYPGIRSIAKLITTIDTSTDLWLVFEKCGIPLTELLWELKGSFHKGTRIYTCRRRSFWKAMKQDTNVLRKFLLKLFEALELISDSNTVHSDLKPDNVLVNYMRGEDNFHSLKVIDFGSAYDFDNVEKVNSATPEYLPPEALSLQCARKVGHSSETVKKTLRDDSAPHAVDMWSVGCIFLEICSGFPLWFSYKSKVDNGNVFLKGLFAVNGRTPEKIIARQIDVVSNLPSVLKKYPELGLSNDPYAMDLLCSMLHLDPKCRISPKDAMNHPFITKLFSEFDEEKKSGK